MKISVKIPTVILKVMIQCERESSKKTQPPKKGNEMWHRMLWDLYDQFKLLMVYPNKKIFKNDKEMFWVRYFKVFLFVCLFCHIPWSVGIWGN